MSDPILPPDTPMTSFVCVRDRARAKAFYSDVLGLTLTADTPFALVYESGGRLLRISEAPDLKPQDFTVVGWVVKDIRRAVRALTDKGVPFNRYPTLEQDELGLWQPPGSKAYVAWFKDPDGNVLSLNQEG